MPVISYDTTLTVDTTPNPHGLSVGDITVIAGNSVAAYNGTYKVSAVLSATSYKVPFSQVAAGAPVGNAGTSTKQGATLARLSGVVTGTTTTAHGFQVGWYVVVAGIGAAWNGTFQVASVPSATTFTYYQAGADAVVGGAGTATPQGQISQGTHQVVVIFLTRQGALTAPSPTVAFTAAGSKFVQVSNLPIGPPNVVARVIGFTGAGGGNFFTILAQSSLKGGIIVNPTVIPDNTTSTAVLDFNDNSLFASTAIDVEGNDLFDQVVLGTVCGFFAYASRIFAWGEANKVQNLLSMGFEGGYLAGTPTVPLGWTVAAAGGALVTGAAGFGGAWQMTGDGTATDRGTIQQSAYQDGNGVAILQPLTHYSIRCWAMRNTTANGTLAFAISSPSQGTLATASVAVSSLSQLGAFIPLTAFSAAMPATIPSDAILQVAGNSLDLNGAVTVDELELVFSEQPYLDNLARGSYINNPEAFAATTSAIGPADDPTQVRCFSTLRSTVLLKTLRGFHEFQDNGTGEPGTWDINEVTHSIGAVSIRAGDAGQFGSGDSGENWDVTLCDDGLYLFAGGDLWKISQEYQPYFDRINKAAQHTCWVKNDINNRRILVGVPLDAATTPNIILVLDYRELLSSTQIASSTPVHISFTGKMIASDLARKWTRWNIAAKCGQVLRRPGNVDRLHVGLTTGNLYWFDPTLLTDDDLGQIFPYYVTYGFVSHDQEIGFGIGSLRKLLRKVRMYVSGTGLISFTPLVDSLQNPLPRSSTRRMQANTSAATAVTQDTEWTTTTRGDRIFLKIQADPITDKTDPRYTNGTDVQFNLQKLIASLTKDPIALQRSSAL